MAIKKQTKELVDQGSHHVKVSTIVPGTKGRKYQAVCRDCDWKGDTIGAGSAADREGVQHAKDTVGALKQSEEQTAAS